MQYDAIGLGEKDLTAGLEFLNTILKEYNLPLLSANLIDPSSNKPLFSPYLLKEIGSIQVAVIGLTSSQVNSQFNKEDSATVVPWQEALPPLLNDLKKSSDLLVLLSSYSIKINEEIAKSQPGIHIIVQAGSGIANFSPRQIENTLILQAGKQGKYLGWLDVNWQNSKKWGADNSEKLLQVKKNELGGINGRINRYQNRMSPEKLKAHTGYQNLLLNRERILLEIEELQTVIKEKESLGEAHSTYKNRFIAMEKNMPDDQPVAAVVEKTKQLINQIGQRRKANSLKQKQIPVQQNNLSPASLRYSGWRECADCHNEQTVFWQTTGHASAYQTLKTKKQHFNLDCLPCHVTYDSSEPAAAMLSLPSELLQVGCEVCHGPGKQHMISSAAKEIVRKPDAKTCLKCHTPDNDDNFNYKIDIKSVGCPT